MKSITISKNDASQRLDRFLLKTFDTLPKSMMYKEIRKKNIKINKKRCTPEQMLIIGDIIDIYIKDEMLCEKKVHLDFMKASKKLDIIYQDDNIILINKDVGILCHPDGNEYIDTVIARVKRYLYEKGEYSPNQSSFSPSLANRIDRNTSGIVIVAKNADALRELNKAIKLRNIDKFYLAVISGKPKKSEDILTGYLTKDTKNNKVTITKNKVENSKEVITKYKVIDYYPDCSLVEIELLTGRTHQIRAHFASIGHPLVNDGKYSNEHGRYNQALVSYKLLFHFDSSSMLSYLNQKEFEIKNNKLYKSFKEK